MAISHYSTDVRHGKCELCSITLVINAAHILENDIDLLAVFPLFVYF